MWRVVHLIHIIPEDDIVPHTDSPDCVCGPTIEDQEVQTSGEPETRHTAYLVTHHPLDQRE